MSRKPATEGEFVDMYEILLEEMGKAKGRDYEDEDNSQDIYQIEDSLSITEHNYIGGVPETSLEEFLDHFIVHVDKDINGIVSLPTPKIGMYEDSNGIVSVRQASSENVPEESDVNNGIISVEMPEESDEPKIEELVQKEQAGEKVVEEAKEENLGSVQEAKEDKAKEENLGSVQEAKEEGEEKKETETEKEIVSSPHATKVKFQIETKKQSEVAGLRDIYNEISTILKDYKN